MQLRAKEIEKSYRGRKVVNGISLEVNQGEIVSASQYQYQETKGGGGKWGCEGVVGTCEAAPNYRTK